MRSTLDHDLASDAEDTKRLAKVVAALVPCSRREAEQYIAEGWVRVEGRIVEEPQFRVGNERVEVDPQARLHATEPVTLIVHKPAGMSDVQLQDLVRGENRWPADDTGIRRIKRHSVGQQLLLPLPPEASGLSVFSQDGRIVRKLREDAGLLEQELLADVTGQIAPNGLARLAGGMMFRAQPLPPARVSWQSEQRLRFAVKGIHAETIPWMCEQVGLRLTALKRIRIGRVPMAGLPPGQWRYLRFTERF